MNKASSVLAGVHITAEINTEAKISSYALWKNFTLCCWFCTACTNQKRDQWRSVVKICDGRVQVVTNGRVCVTSPRSAARTTTVGESLDTQVARSYSTASGSELVLQFKQARRVMEQSNQEICNSTLFDNQV